MSFKRITSIAAAAMLGLTATAASAQGYGALGAFDWELQYGDSDQDMLSSKGMRAIGGYMVSDYVGLEAHIATGGSDHLDYPVDDSTTEDAKAELNKLLGVFARANLPAGERINVFGLFGYSHGRVDILAETTTAKINESGFGWGAGIEIALLPERLYLSLDHIEYFSQQDIDATATTLGFRLAFSQ